ncbi:MAG: cytochrome c biogenesis protein CcdA [Myxococcota bacterium]
MNRSRTAIPLLGVLVFALPCTAWAAGEDLQTSLAGMLEGSLADGTLWLALGSAWLGGFLTALTPCVYPLIPVTVRYFGAMDTSRSRVIVLATLYVLGMTLLYATLGTAFASANKVFGSFLSVGWVVISLAIFCAAMGASMLGAFTMALPASLNTKLSTLGGNSMGGAIAMGLVVGLIAAPCTGPVLSVLLTVVASSGRLVLGFGLMTCFGLGLGLPFLLLAIFSAAFRAFPPAVFGWKA